MNKTEFVKLLTEKIKTLMVNADKNLKLVFETIEEAISKEDTFLFIGFRIFKTRIKKASEVKTPQGTIVYAPKKKWSSLKWDLI